MIGLSGIIDTLERKVQQLLGLGHSENPDQELKTDGHGRYADIASYYSRLYDALDHHKDMSSSVSANQEGLDDVFSMLLGSDMSRLTQEAMKAMKNYRQGASKAIGDSADKKKLAFRMIELYAAQKVLAEVMGEGEISEMAASDPDSLIKIYDSYLSQHKEKFCSFSNLRQNVIRKMTEYGLNAE